MTRIAVLGATGRTGIEVVKLALEKNLDVLAIVRNPDKLPENIRKNSKCKIVQVKKILKSYNKKNLYTLFSL